LKDLISVKLRITGEFMRVFNDDCLLLLYLFRRTFEVWSEWLKSDALQTHSGVLITSDNFSNVAYFQLFYLEIVRQRRCFKITCAKVWKYFLLLIWEKKN